jgi:carbon starvation protein CstA
MLEQLKFQVLHTRWHLIRILQLVLATMVLIQAITDKHYILIIPAVWLIYMSLMNTCSSCSTGSCGTNNAAPENKNETIQYKEIK